MRHTILIGLCCCLPVLGAFAADSGSVRAPTDADKRLSTLTQQQLEISFALQEQARQHETLWLNPKFSSPEIKALRQRYEGLKREQAEIEAQLRAAVAELPEVQAEEAKAGKQRDQYRALGKEIEELTKQRAPAR